MLLIDTETTGLLGDPTGDNASQPGIVQIGILVIGHKFEIIDEWSTLINPEIEDFLWQKEAIAVHGITPEAVASAPTLPSVLYEISRMTRLHDTWVGYNNQFDRKVLYHQLVRYGWHMKFPWPTKDIDVMLVGRDVMNPQGKKDLKNPKLVDLYEHLFDEKYENAHDALSDCRATLRCGKRMLELGHIIV